MTPEQLVMQKAWEKYCDNPTYKFTQEECIAVSTCAGREILPLAALLDELPAELPDEKTIRTIDSLNPYLQKMIWRFAEAWNGGRLVEMKLEFSRLQNLVPPEVIEKCVCELQVDRELRQQLFDQYPHPPGEKYDHAAPTVQEQAESLRLTMISPDLERGLYVGTMVGQDFQSALIKFAAEKSIKLPFLWLEPGQARPKMGETVRMKFTKGDLAVSVAEHKGKPLE